MDLSPEELRKAESAIPPPKRARPPLTLGRMAYLGYYYPRHLWKSGLRRNASIWLGRARMRRALDTLAPPPPPLGPVLPAHLLLGAPYVPLASVALLSLQAQTGRPVAPVLHDDGTLSPPALGRLRAFFPALRVITADEIRANLDRVLPEARHPFLRRLRLGYVHLRKLTDVHTAPEGPDWKLVMDSDVFFYHPPAVMTEWIQAPRWFHMVDCVPAYGAPDDSLSALAGAPVHPKANVGVCHLHTPSIDWDFLEHAARVLLARHGFSYFLEQALTAVLMARFGACALPADDYLVNPSPAESAAPRAAALHFVERSLVDLYRHGWSTALAPLRGIRPRA